MLSDSMLLHDMVHRPAVCQDEARACFGGVCMPCVLQCCHAAMLGILVGVCDNAVAHMKGGLQYTA